MHSLSHIRIATRKSPLAIAQAEIVKTKMLATFSGITAEIVPMSTTGDENVNRSLSDIGGKGLFTKELEEALLAGKIDMAVHSLKDMETNIARGLAIAAMLEREDPCDALISWQGETLKNLKKAANIGTSSLRRATLVKIIRPDLEIVPFRGNVTTRLKKLENGDVDATILAMAGLKRLGLENRVTEVLDTKYFIPAVGQGVIAVECKENNNILREMLQKINHTPTYIAATCERAMLAMLDGSCRTPIGGYARFEANRLRIDAFVASRNGTTHIKATRTGSAENGKAIGEDVALELLANGGKECLK